MRYFIWILFVLLAMASAYAANTPPPGNNGDIIYNKNNQYGAACVGTGLALTTSAGVTCLGTTGPPPPSGDFITTETGDPIVTETGDNIVTETSP